LLTVIIPTFNRHEQLGRTLKSLLALKTNRKLFEIIIVDNGSTEETSITVKRYQLENTDTIIRYFYDSEPGLLTGRHKGAAEAKGEILSFIDDDVQLSSDWLDTIILIMEKRPDITFMTGPNLPLYESYPPKWIEDFWIKTDMGKYCYWLSLSDFGNEIKEINVNMVWGLNFTIRKAAFFELGGFHPDSIPSNFQHFQGDGETGLTMKGEILNKKALYHPGLLLYHEVSNSRMTYDYFDKRAYYQGVCNSYTKIRRDFFQLGNQKSISPSRYIKNVIIRKILHKIKSLVRKNHNEENIEYLKLNTRFKQKEKEGFDFHHKVALENQVLKNWVLKSDYFDYKLPKLKI